MKKLRYYFGLVMLSTLIFGCTEDRIQREVLKPAEQVMAKSAVDQEALYLYTPLVKESSRTTLYGRAFEVGQAKVVKMQINELSLIHI